VSDLHKESALSRRRKKTKQKQTQPCEEKEENKTLNNKK
jgi:hypothetical protein